jgi:hypothetical protein
MADLNTLYTALQNADAAGDVAAATELATYIRQITTPEKTIGGYAKEALKGFGRGAVNLLEQSAVGAAALLPEEIEKPVVAKTQELAERFTPKAAPGYEEAIPTRLAEGLGSMAATIFTPGTIARTGMLAAAGAGEARQRAQQEGATPEQISTATAQGILPGLIDVLPVQFLLGRVGKVALDGLISRGVRMAATGGVEGATEAAQNIMQNAIARGYKPEQDLYEGAGEAGAYGAGVGAIAQGLLDLAMPGRARRVTPQQVRAEPPVLETPVPEAPVLETPVPEAPVLETPVPEAPVLETTTPVAPAPVAPAPVAPAPVAPAPVAPAPVAPAPVALATKAPQKQLSWKKFLASNPDETALAARKIENDKRIAEELGKIKPNFYTVNALKEQQKKLDKMLSGAAVQVAPLASLTLKEPKNVNVVPDVGKDAKSDADRKRTEEPVLPPTPDDRTATQPVGGGVDISGKRVGEPVEGAPKQYAPLTVESFVADRVAGKLQDSPEEIQFYLNNKDAIEAALTQAQGKAAAKPKRRINKAKLEKKVQAESDLTPEEQAELQAELDEELGQVTEKPKRRINKAKLEKKVAAPEVLSPERQKLADELARVKTAPKAVQKYVAHYKGIDEAIKMLGFETGYKGLVQNERGYLQPSAKEVRVFADWVDSNGTPEQKTALATYQKEAAELKTKAENEQLVKSREQPQKLRRAIREQLTREELAERETKRELEEDQKAQETYDLVENRGPRFSMSDMRKLPKLSDREFAEQINQRRREDDSPYIVQETKTSDDINKIADEVLDDVMRHSEKYAIQVRNLTADTYFRDEITGEPVDYKNPEERYRLSEQGRQLAAMDPVLLKQALEEEAETITRERQIALKDLAKYLYRNEGYTPTEAGRIVLLASKLAYTESNGKVNIVKLSDNNRHVMTVSGELAARLNEKLNSGLSIRDALKEAVGENTAAQRKIQDKQGWVKYPQSEDYEDAAALSQAVCNTGWCTGQTHTAQGQLRDGDFWVYFDTGRPKIALRTINGRLAEPPRGTLDGQRLEPEYQEIAGKFLADTDNVTGGKEFLDGQAKMAAFREFKKTGDIKPLRKHLIYKISSVGVIEDVRFIEPAVLSGYKAQSSYFVTDEEYSGKTISSKFPYSLSVMAPNLSVTLKEVGGDFYAEKLIEAPMLAKVGGDFLARKLIEAPMLAKVGGMFTARELIEAPMLAKVGGDFFAEKLIEAPMLTEVGGAFFADDLTKAPMLTKVSVYFYAGKLIEAPMLAKVGGMFNARELIEAPMLTEVGGVFDAAKLTEAPMLAKVGEDFYADKLIKAPMLTEVSGEFTANELIEAPMLAKVREGFSASSLTKAPMLTEVGERFIANELIEAPMLAKVGGRFDADELTEAPMLTKVGGDFLARKLIEAPMLTEVGGEFTASELIKAPMLAKVGEDRASKAKPAAPTGHTAEGVTKALKKYFKEDSRFDALTTVVQSEKDLPEIIRNSKGYQAGTRGVAYKGKVWLVADNISQGKELGVFLHEAGAHIGFDNVLKASDRKFLADQVRKWAKGNDDLIETKAAKVALEKGGVSDDEIIAYMTEELINRGVSPTNFRPASTWLRRVFDAFKKALAKIGLRKDITPQELVDVAYGAAHIALKAPGKASVEAPRFSQANPAMDRANPITLDKFSGPSAPKSIVKHAIDSRLGGGGGSVMQKVRQNMASRTTWWEDWFAAIHGNDALDTAGMASANDRLQASTKVRNIQLAALELGGFGKNNKGLWEAQSTDASYKDIIEQVNSMVGKYRATPDFASAEKFFDWAASAKREEGLIAAGKTTDVGGAIKRTLTDTQLKEGLDIYNSTPEIREALRLYEKFNNRNVDTLVTAGVIDAATAQDLKGAAGYVPWFRWTEDKDGNINIARVKSYSKGLINLSEMRDLEGGRIDDIQINSVLDNMARLNNWMVNKSIGNDTAAYMVDYALQYKKARKVGASSAAGLDSRRVVKIMRNGQETFYELEDPMMLAAFKGYETAHGAMTETFAAPARLLRKGITLFPVFSLAQLPQDTIRAFATSGLKNPYALIPRILINFLKEVFGGSDTSRRLAQFGIVGKGVDIPTDDISKGLRRRFKMGEGQGLHSKAYDMLEKWSNASDAAVRTALYELTMKESQGNEVLALRRAREIINFDIQGSGQYASFLRQTVPFMGVYMNDLNNLYKGLVLGSSRMSEGEKAATRRSIIWNGSQLAALTMLYTLMTMDDDDYKKLDDNTRNRSFIIPGSNLRVPVPSDGVGFIFKVVPEQITRAVFTEGIEGEDIGGRVARALGKGLLDMGSFENYLPGGPLAKVSVETILNRNFYTQNPIVGKSKEHLEPFLQYTEGTSELSKQLAESARKAGIGISPLKVDHLVRGLTGQVGGFVLGMSNALIHAAEGKVTPSIRLEDIAELRAFTYSSRDKAALEDFYELRERVDMVARTYRDFISAGKGKEAIEYLSDPDNQRAYALRNIQVRVEQDLAKFRKMRKLILERTDLTSDDMREELNRLDTRQTQYLESLRLPKLRAFADIFPSLKSNVQKLVQ